MGKLKVVVLMGGRSEEREISLKTGSGILRALNPDRYDVIALDTGGVMPPLSSREAEAALSGSSMDGVAPIAGTLVERVMERKERPDVVFIALHGKYGEDGTVQGMLDLVDIPYTGSGVLASALAMNKAMSKKIFKAEGIPTPPFILLDSAAGADHVADYFALPLVVKPNRQGSSHGMTIVRERAALRPAVEKALRHDDEALIEKFIGGREITAAVLGNRDPQVLPLVEIAPKHEFFDFEAKYTPGQSDYFVPARLADADARAAREYALRAHKALECRGISRVDMIVDDEGVWVLEVNTIPGMTPTSLVPKAAAAVGISYADLCEQLIQFATEAR